MKQFSLAILASSMIFTTAQAQQLVLPSLSPSSTIIQEFSTSKIEINYSRPSKRDRVIFGKLVPYNTIWRTGANAATRIKTEQNLNIGGVQLPAGDYALYTIPGKDEWEVIINKGIGNWGAGGYKTSDDLARFKVKPETLPNTVETFTIQFSNLSFDACNLDLIWDKTKVSIPIKSTNAQEINLAIQKAIERPNIPYFRAASYYYSTNQNLEKAFEYVSKATADNPEAFYMWDLQAKIAKAIGKKEEAIKAAEKAIETAKGTPNEAHYTTENQELIKALK